MCPIGLEKRCCNATLSEFRCWISLGSLIYWFSNLQNREHSTPHEIEVPADSDPVGNVDVPTG
jgi:hypothetical protein